MSNKPSFIKILEKAHELHRKHNGFKDVPKGPLKKLLRRSKRMTASGR